MSESSTRAWAKWLAIAGLLLIVAAVALPLFGVSRDIYAYIFLAGALCVLVGRIANKCPADDLRVRRLYRMEVWSGIVFCVGAFFLFYKGVGPMDWMAFTLAGGVLEAYASLMIPRALAKAASKEHGKEQ